MAAQADREQRMTARVAFDFTGTRALITGGTSGIGHATAVLFRDAGADITVTGTRGTAGEYDTDLSGMTYAQLVLTDPASIAAVKERFDSLDVLINNAGANFPGGLDESAPDGFDASVALNLNGTYRLTVALRRALKASTAPLTRKLDPVCAAAAELKKATFNEAAFRFALNEDALATEKTAEGIRLFSADIVKLEQLIAQKRG